MKRTNPNPALTDLQLDAALGSERDRILPSSGFVDAVMGAVRQEAAAPAPIPFPWKRALPGMIAVAAMLATLLVLAARAFVPLVRQAAAAPAASGGSLVFTSWLRTAATPQVLGPMLALALPLLCLLLLHRLLLAR